MIYHGFWMGELPKAKLDEIGRAYSVAFECTGVMSQKAAITAGCAIGILYESNLETNMRVLGIKDGFPVLPKLKRSIVISPEAPQTVVAAMLRAIRSAV